MDYITLMPLDVQNLIRNETHFARLNKSMVSGMNHLQQLARQKVTKQEIVHYIDSLPKYVVLFTHTHVIELILENGKIYSIYGCLLNNMELKINHIRKKLYLDQIQSFIHKLDISHCDIFTTNAIYHLRKELLYSDISIKDLIVEEYNNHTHYDDNVINKMHVCIYILSYFEQYGFNDLRPFLVPLKVTIREFNITEVNEYLDFVYNKYKPTVDKYLIEKL